MNATAGEMATLHIFDAGRMLGPWSARILAAFEPAVVAVARYIEISDVDVVAYPGSFVIPELGMNAFTEHGHLVRFWLDPKHSKIAECFDPGFPALLAHELHHVVRTRGPGYGATLRESLVSEGLACQFEKQVTGRLPVYGIEFPVDQVRERLARIAPLLDGPFLPNWMFGSHEQGIERSFGYRLGRTLVGQWLQQQRCTAAEAVHINHCLIAREW